MRDWISPAVFIAATIPVLGLHAYLAVRGKRKSAIRLSIIASFSAIFGATAWVWSIEADKSPQNSNGLAAGFAVQFCILGIIGMQLAIFGIDWMMRAPRKRSYYEEAG